MKLSTFKTHLNNVNELNFVQPNGAFVPKHFHITEAGLVTKNFIDCGGTVRSAKAINLQLWVAGDTAHKLAPEKLLGIIGLSQKLFGNEDLDIEVAYQSETIGTYGLDFTGEHFMLTTKHTTCLAKDTCGNPKELQPAETTGSKSCCTPGGGCC